MVIMEIYDSSLQGNWCTRILHIYNPPFYKICISNPFSRQLYMATRLYARIRRNTCTPSPSPFCTPLALQCQCTVRVETRYLLDQQVLWMDVLIGRLTLDEWGRTCRHAQELCSCPPNCLQTTVDLDLSCIPHNNKHTDYIPFQHTTHRYNITYR